MFYEYYAKVKEKKPIVHNITNYVTVNDVANIILASGGSPIMADEIDEIEDICKISNSLNINIGTINKIILESMLKAQEISNKLDHPIVLDMVGVGASKFRYESVLTILKNGHINVIKGNLSEIETLYNFQRKGSGVDVEKNSKISDKNIIFMMKQLSKRYNSIIVCTGEIDYISDGKDCYKIFNGHKKMKEVTGTGCQLTGLIATFIAIDCSIKSVVSAVALLGIAGEKAYEMQLGNSSYRNLIIDNINLLDTFIIDKEIKYEVK